MGYLNHRHTRTQPASGFHSRRLVSRVPGTVIRLAVMAALAGSLATIDTTAHAALSTAPTGQKSWYWQNPLPQGNTLYSVDAPEGGHVWAVGGPGVVLHSSDGGAQWEPQDPNLQYILRGLDFVDDQTGWIVGDGNTVKRTNDGGQTWTSQGLINAITARDISMVDDQTGWVVGIGGAVRKTVNGGSTAWTTVASGTTRQLNDVDAVDSTHAWAVGGTTSTEGVIVATTDGVTWATQSIPTTQGLNAVSMATTQTGFAVGNRNTTTNTGTVLKTTDGGTTWNPLSITYLNALGTPVALNTTMRAAAFRDELTGWIAGDSGLVLYTEDGGTTWTSQKSGSQAIYSIAPGPAESAHMVGVSGVMLRTENNGGSWRGQQQGTTVRLNGGTWTGPTSGLVVGAAGLVMKTEDAGDSWASRTLGPNDLYDIHFADSDTGWLVGSSGFVRKSTDAGSSWDAQTSGTTEHLYSLATFDDETVWACGTAGTIIKTTDGGATWTPQVSGTTATLNDIVFIDANRGWAVGTGGTVRTTTDGGATWTAQTSGLTTTISAVYFTDANNGWFAGATGRIRRTTNGGATWTAQTSGTTTTLYSIEMADESNGWAVGGASTGSVVLHTTNGGTTWTEQDAGFRGILRHVTVAGPDQAGIVGDGGAMRRTFDAGATWELTGFWSISFYRALAFPAQNEGWAVGDSGAIAHTHDGGLTWGAQQSGGTNALYAVDFPTPAKGWAVGAGGVIRTTLTHTTWTTQTSPTTQVLRGVSFADASTGWAVGAAGTVIKTTNAGANWASQTSGVPAATTLYGVSAVDTQTAFAWGTGGTFIETSDGGSTWDRRTISSADLYAGSFVDSQTAWVAGTSGTVLKTTDGGTNWTSQTASAGAGSNALWSMDFLDVNQGYLVGAGGVVRKTVDGGNTWTVQLPGTSNALYGVGFTDEDHGWVVGATGSILRTTDNTSPNTTLVVEPAEPNGKNGWYVGQPEISFVSDEPGLTYYSWTSATGPWTTYSAPVVPPSDGELTIYYYSVDPGGNKETVKSQTGKIDATPPSTPSTPTATAQSATEVVMTWDAVTDLTSGIDYYEVRDYESLIGTSPVNSMTLSSLTTETAHSLTVTAVDVAGNASGRSGATEVTTLANEVRPPFAVHAADAGVAGIVVNWAESTGTVAPVQYRVWRSVDGAPFTMIATVAETSDLSFADGQAPRLAALRYGVSTVDARGEGPRSTTSGLTTTEARILPPPIGLTPRNTESVTLTWTPSPLAEGYHVYRSVTSTGTETTLTASPVTVATYHDSTTTPYTEYWYSVASVDASDNVGTRSARTYIRTEAAPASETTQSPHGLYDRDTNMCAVCHRTHSATGPRLLAGTSTIDAPLCLSCHDGTSASDILTEFTDAQRTSRHPVPMSEGATGTLECSSCHGVHSAGRPDTVKGLLLAGSAKSGNEYCYHCHGTTSTLPRGDLQVFEDSSHKAGVLQPPTGTKVVCLSCHVGHTSREASLYPYAANDRCLRCHSYGSASGYEGDIAAKLSGEGYGTRHDLLSADSSATGSSLGCSNCHEPHTSTETTPCVDPDEPSTSKPLSAEGTTLCFRCHDEALPTSVDTSGWAQAPLGTGGTSTTSNIKAVWDTNVHGDGDADDPQLKSAMGFGPDNELDCATCHDAHGSSNEYALLESVEASGSAASADNLSVAPVSGGGWDLRFYCDSCHELTVENHTEADISVWPTNCTASGCHTHASNGL